jgi:hypothetical protein
VFYKLGSQGQEPFVTNLDTYTILCGGDVQDQNLEDHVVLEDDVEDKKKSSKSTKSRDECTVGELIHR